MSPAAAGSIDTGNRHSGDRIAPVGVGSVHVARSLNPVTDMNDAFGLSWIVDVIPTRGSGYELARLGVGLTSRVIDRLIPSLNWPGERV